MNTIAKVAAFALFCVMGNSCIVASALADAGGSAAGKTMDPAIAAEAQKENCWYSYNEGWYDGVGNWTVDTNRYDNGIKELSDYAKKKERGN